MSLSAVSSIAVSGMQAGVSRLTASASNTVNIDSTGSLDPTAANQPYTPVTVQQSAVVGSNGTGQGTTTVYRPSSAPVIATYDPSDSNANSSGLVGSPNVDLASERVNQITANNTYQTNLKVFKAQDQMMQTLLNTTA
ncbi:MAG: flagellar basal body rod C-terminal domain-containing protein [Azospirillaceae bacterium]|nr:flagellar basal body rod C-terminal domain-containing protein [Azospirillaceae bacterium]